MAAEVTLRSMVSLKTLRNPVWMLRARWGTIKPDALKKIAPRIEKRTLLNDLGSAEKAGLTGSLSYFVKKRVLPLAAIIPLSAAFVLRDYFHPMAGAFSNSLNAISLGLCTWGASFLSFNRAIKFNQVGAAMRVMQFGEPLEVARVLNELKQTGTKRFLLAKFEGVDKSAADHIRDLTERTGLIEVIGLLNKKEINQAVASIAARLQEGSLRQDDVDEAVANLEANNPSKAVAVKNRLGDLKRSTLSEQTGPSESKEPEVDLAAQLKEASEGLGEEEE